MKRVAGLVVAAAMVMAPAAQAAPPQSAPVTAAPHGDDGATIDTLIAALYAVISGPAGPRDWGRFRQLFLADGRLVPVGPTGPTILSPQAFADSAIKPLEKDGFFETEVERRTERYGNIAHVWSTYESRRTADGAPFARGINSIQLVRVAGSWRILSITWQSETPAFPLPDAYLPTTPQAK